MDGEKSGEMDNYYTLVPEQGLCCVGEVILNLRQIAAIRKMDGKTLVYYPGVAEAIILPVDMFDRIRDAVFAMDDFDDDDEEEQDEEDEEE